MKKTESEVNVATKDDDGLKSLVKKLEYQEK